MPKKPDKDLKKYHLILSEIGIIFSLLFLIAATNINTGNQSKTEKDLIIPDKPVLIVLPPTIPPKKPAPQKPMIFISKPDDQVIDAEIPEFPEFGEFADKIILPLKDEAEPLEKTVVFLPVMPTIIGGQEELYSKIIYPEIPKKANIEGRVVVQFVLDKQGNVTDPKIIRSVHPDLDEEVLRVIKLVKFSPGVQNGVLVKVRMVQSINFKLKR
jgi:protein TonB